MKIKNHASKLTPAEIDQINADWAKKTLEDMRTPLVTKILQRVHEEAQK